VKKKKNEGAASKQGRHEQIKSRQAHAQAFAQAQAQAQAKQKHKQPTNTADQPRQINQGRK
jgi:hypothetical protein